MEKEKANEKTEERKLGLREKLCLIQEELKVPKAQWNSFSEFWYRSCEDILIASKPVCKKYRTLLVLDDEIVQVGNSNYVKATATLYDLDDDKYFSVSANARESESKKGMDGSQLTGTASSYARKYALNGLFCLDDEKDADTDAYVKRTSGKEESSEEILLTENQKNYIKNIFKEDVDNLKEMLKQFNKKKVDELTIKEASKIIEMKKGM